MHDVQDTLMNAKRAYDSKPASKARKWLVKFSSNLIYYGNVLDVLVQHQLDYVSLAWGAFNFLFIAVLNHEESIVQLSKALSQIADILPRAELSLILYPTHAMMENAARLYAHILRFSRRAIVWYRHGKLKHCWDAIARPWAVGFKDELEEIEQRSRQMDSLASAASKAELHDTHLELTEARKKLLRVSQGNAQIMALCRQYFPQLVDFANSYKTLQIHLQQDLRDQKEIICNIQLSQILLLSIHASSTQRSHEASSAGHLYVAAWASEPKSSVLFTQSGPDQASKNFGTELTTLIRDTNLPIIWALRFPNYWESELSWTAVLRMLVFQAIQLNPQALTDGSHPLILKHLREAASEDDWLLILGRALLGIVRVFIVLDTDIIAHATGHDKYQAARHIESMGQKLIPTFTLIFTSRSTAQQTYVKEHWESSYCINIQTDRTDTKRAV
ncbi:hypothetical protein MMC29_001558 [Sticta canariensis]|nr:hypothetical protein [Sticta canariensis]